MARALRRIIGRRGDRDVARILIIDDEALNRELVAAFLDASGHELDFARNGNEGLERAAACAPDLVILDVMMPGIDGFTTTTHLKAMYPGSFLPVILATGSGDHDAKLRGLAAGADEFLTKPLDREELLLRVGNLLMLRAHDVALARRSVELLELSRFKDDMLATLVHDLRSLATVILGAVDFVGNSPGLDADSREVLDDCREASGRMMRMVKNILDLSRAEEGHLSPRPTEVRLTEVVTAAVGPRRMIIERRGVVFEIATGDMMADIDRDLITRVVENLLDNALRYTPAGGTLRAWATEQDGRVILRVGNSGEAIAEPARAHIFDKYTQGGATGDAPVHNVGLGLYFCRVAVEAHGGTLWLEQTDELPVVFALSLPAGRASRRSRPIAFAREGGTP